MRTIICLLALVAITFAQISAPAGCGGCSDGCVAPYSGAACQNNVWVYPADLTFTGTVQLDCAIAVTGSASFTAGTTLNLIPCASITVGGDFNAPTEGLNVIVDFLGEANPFKNKYVFATYKGDSTGHIGSMSVTAIGGSDPLPSLGGRLGKGEAAITFNAKDSNEGNGDLGKPKAWPGFDEKGNKLRVCKRFTCADPAVCPSPKPGSVCDPSGAWVVPGPSTVAQLTVNCPTRFQGDLTVTQSISMGGCGRITVDGTAKLSSAQGVSVNRIPVSSHIYVQYDLNDYGTPSGEGDHITWLTAGRIVGGIYGVSGSNIWSNTLSIFNQKCDNLFNLYFYQSGSHPPANCLKVPVAAVADYDDDATADSAVVDYDDDATADNAVVDYDDEATVDNVIGDYEAATADNVDEFVSSEYLDNAASDTQNTNSNTADAASATPAYAYALFVLAVLVLIALVIVQVQIVLIRRARESARI
jgi:hypothetical protein